MGNLDNFRQSGQVLVLAVVVVGLVLVNSLIIISGSQVFSQNTNYAVQSTQAVNLAEAGIDKAVASLNATGGSYAGEEETPLGAGSFSVAITTPDAATKVIESTGYIPSKANHKVKRTVQITTSKGMGVSFNYGVQVGDGGLNMEENSRVNGSVYSNGSINMDNHAKITVDAYVAGGIATTADQQSDCISPNCTDFIFGKNVGGSDRLDVAQSFKPGSSNYLGRVAIKLKKIGSPPDIMVRILADSNGKPDKSEVLASGTLAASLVTDQYGFVEVVFSDAPYLSANTTYWMMLDTSSNLFNYWSWSADSLQGYTRGSASWSSDWQAKNPAWNAISSDLGFKTYMGGLPTYIQGGNNDSNIGGNAHANTLTKLTIVSGAYYQTIADTTAGSYHPGSPDPSAKAMPVSDANITNWKTVAQGAGIYGNISSCISQLGPGKYVGNVTFPNSCVVTVQDPVWITGNLTLNNGVNLKLGSSYGASSGVVIVDGVISTSTGVNIQGSGTAGSYLLALSAFDSRTNGQTAIDVANGGNMGILYAPYGIIEIKNTTHLNEVTAWKIILDQGVIITYDTGLAGTFFSSGPSGSFSLVKGTYQLK